MNPLKNFEEYESQDLNESFLSSLLLGDIEGAARSWGLGGDGDKPAQASDNQTVSGTKILTIDSKPAGAKPSPTVSGKDKSGKGALPTVDQIPGNDDFLLYMQHQQGVAGATGLIRASMGIGRMASDTIKTKRGVKYANLIMNVPSDRPKVKEGIIKALDAGNQKLAALLFMSMWKEKWNSKYKQAQNLIQDESKTAVRQAIKKYCDKYAVPFDFAATVATIESGLNPKSGNRRYKGLFALSQEEFNNYVKNGDIYNIDNNANAGVQCLKNNIRSFMKYMGSTAGKIDVSKWATVA